MFDRTRFGWFHRIAVTAAVLPAVCLLAGCGGSSGTPHSTSASDRTKVGASDAEHPINMFPVLKVPPGGEQSAVVRVGGAPITRAAFVHWANLLTPKLASFEPADRADCSAVRAPLEMKYEKQDVSGLSTVEVDALCVRRKQKLVKEAVLQQLISTQWVIGEAADLGVGVSQAEGEQLLNQDVAEQFKSRAEFLQYEARTGRTVADALSDIRLETATERVFGLIKRKAERRLTQAAIARYYHQHEKSLSHVPFKQVEEKARESLSEELLNREKASFIRAFREKWLAKTTCSPGYVVSRCREWRGPSVVTSENAYDLK